jgi:hypothetical protein
MVTVMSKEDSSEDAQWHSLAANALARAYGEDEPDYFAADVKPGICSRKEKSDTAIRRCDGL